VAWSLNAILAFVSILQPTLFFVLYWWDSSKIPKLHGQCDSRPLLDGFALEVNVSYIIRWIFCRLSGSSILVFRSWQMRFAFSVCNMLTSLKLVACVTSSMTVLKVSATPGIVTTMIDSSAYISAGCPWGDVVWISNRRRGTEFNLWSGYHSRFHRQCWESRCVPKSPTLPGYSPIKWTVATPLQLSQSPISKALPLQQMWKSCQYPFHPPPVLLAYQHPKPTSSHWTIWPQLGAPET